MMRLYQWFVTVALLLGFSPALSVGQQWSGNSNTTDPIGRTGNVGIGTTSPSFRVSIAGGYQTSGLTHTADYLHIGATGASPNAAQIVFGDNTGWKLHVGTRVSGTFTERMTILDTGNVGIGTTGPAKKLDVIGDLFVGNGAVGRIYLGDQNSKNDYIENNDVGGGGYRFVADGLERVRIAIGGNIGIGTTSPGEKLQVVGNIRSDRSDNTKAVLIDPSNTRIQFFRLNGSTNVGTIGRDGGDNLFIDANGAVRVNARSTDYVAFLIANVEKMRVHTNGTVGIGTTTPDPAYLLSVNGKIRAKEIKVETGWADMVFDDGYPLIPLSELEARIKQQKHLPGIPTATEVKANGVSLGEMQAKLLQKIEELTLYVIALKKENDALKTRVSSLEQQNKP